MADLTSYPSWLGIVHGAAPDGDGWLVEVGARIGPIVRTKRVRMVQAEASPPLRVRFERRELDGRSHAAWVLETTLAPAEAEAGPGTDLVTSLHYSGAPSLPFLDAVLAGEARRAAGRLGDLVAKQAD